MTFAFDTVADFLAMGRYAAFVWSAWLISGVVLGLLILQTRQARRQFYRRQRQLRRQQQARRHMTSTAPIEQTPEQPS